MAEKSIPSIVPEQHHIYVAVEEGIVYERVCSCLQQAGYHVTAFATTRELLASLEEKLPSALVITETFDGKDLAGLVSSLDTVEDSFELPTLVLIQHPKIPDLRVFSHRMLWWRHMPFYCHVFQNEFIRRLLLQKERAEDLKAQARELLRVNPNSIEGCVLLGWAYDSISMIKPAEEWYLKAIKAEVVAGQEKYQAEAHLLFGMHFYGEKMQTAIKEFRAAINIDPNYTAAYFWLGEAYLHTQKLKKACAAWENVANQEDSEFRDRAREQIKRYCDKKTTLMNKLRDLCKTFDKRKPRHL